MNEFDAKENRFGSWLTPLGDDEAPGGPDLEYDNDFLALVQTAAGKPESQFGPAEPPNWRSVLDMSESLLDRTRDLRIAILWLRGGLHTFGYGFMPVGLKLLNGLMRTHWEHVHPLPDPDDGDPYARVNALTVLRETEGLIGDLRLITVAKDRSFGALTGRVFELALGLSSARPDETVYSREQLSMMMSTALGSSPQLRTQCEESVEQLRQLMTQASERLGDDLAPDLKAAYRIVNGIAGLLPGHEPEQGDAPSLADDQAPANEGDVRGRAVSGLPGSINSRAEAVRAIELVCQFLERTEPANPAPLFLRRGIQLVDQNFLQLMKMLAPEALQGVAGLVGIDPQSLDDPPEE